MQRDVEALTALVDDLFLLARIEAGRPRRGPSRIDLAELADEAVEALAPVAEAHGVRLVVALDRAGGGDRQRHRPRAGHPQPGRQRLSATARPGATVELAVRGGDRPVVRVRDEGAGVPGGVRRPRLRPLHPGRHQPEPGHRRHRARPRAIARGLVDAHGGDIWIDTDADGEGRGGSVAFAVPAGPRPAAGLRPVDEASPGESARPGPPRSAPPPAPSDRARRVGRVQRHAGGDDPARHRTWPAR